MESEIKTKKFGILKFKIDKKDYPLIHGYKIYVSKMGNGKYYILREDKKYLHRLIIGEIPTTMVVDHINGDSLDNRRENLRVVSRSENGRNTDKRKFKEDDIIDILTSPLTNNELSRKYKCSNCAISKIKTGEWYSHIVPDIVREKNNTQKKFSPVDIKEIRDSKFSYAKLAKIYKTTKTTIQDIKNYKLYKNAPVYTL